MFTLRPHQKVGPVRAINGVNLGPVDRNYAYDHTPYFRKARIPSVRTHDTPSSARDVVDLHYVFPNPEADPEDPRSYSFRLTDDYLRTIRNAGCTVYYRLGETIEGRHLPRKTYVVAERWKPETLARVCVNIARHYTEGWADGFEWEMPHWQFWNEPQNGWVKPPLERPCWTGTVEQFYTLYRAVSTAMKAHNPQWHIGLAGYGRPDFIFPPGHPLYREDNPWRHVADVVNAGPIDSLSWHQYGASWEDLVSSAQMVRDCLDTHGLGHAESHLTEWNYMPREEDERGVYTWFDARAARDFDRLDHIYEVMTGVEGAAYVFGALARLQAAPLDLAHLYTAINTGALGLFNQHGRPHPKYTGLEAFATFLDHERVAMEGGVADSIAGLAAVANGQLRIGVAHLRPERKELPIRIEGAACAPATARQFTAEGWREVPVEATHETGGTTLHLPIAGSGLTVLEGALYRGPV